MLRVRQVGDNHDIYILCRLFALHYALANCSLISPSISRSVPLHPHAGFMSGVPSISSTLPELTSTKSVVRAP